VDVDGVIIDSKELQRDSHLASRLANAVLRRSFAALRSASKIDWISATRASCSASSARVTARLISSSKAVLKGLECYELASVGV
jgi:hypothetical protein